MKIIVVAVILTLLFCIVTTAYAGGGACKHCYCPEFTDRGDGICDCGHGYGMHGYRREERYPLRPGQAYQEKMGHIKKQQILSKELLWVDCFVKMVYNVSTEKNEKWCAYIKLYGVKYTRDGIT